MTDQTLTFADAVAAIKGGTPNSKGWVNGVCPAHSDTTPSLGIKDFANGRIAFKCQAGCKKAEIIAALEVKTGKKYGAKKGSKKADRQPVERGITLQQYSELKKLPVDYLESIWHEGECIYEGKPAIIHTYWGPDLSIAGMKVRLSIDSHDTLWAMHKESVPYGLFPLEMLRRAGRRISQLTIVEGESDTQTMWFNGIPTIGISGKTGWQDEFARFPQIAEVPEIIIVQEPDAAKEAQRVALSFIRRRVWLVPFPDDPKDPSALWLRNLDPVKFRQVWETVTSKAGILINDGFAPTDTGNAERLVYRFGDDFRWITNKGTFAVWNGCIWEKNDSGENLLPHTKEVARDARAITDPNWSKTSESAGKRKAMIAMTKGETDVLTDDSLFDKHPMLLNVQNGTIDLETGTWREFSRDDFLTKKAPVVFDPLADCPKFDEFMRFIFNRDDETIHWILKALGYSLTGNIGESCFFICYGLGANGKTTLIEIVMQLLGSDFATPAKFSTFIVSKLKDSKYELAQFQDKRLVTSVEPRKAGHLDEEVIKQMTGGDMIRARDIYERDVTYYPEFKLWLAMNNKPRIVGTDDGIWRRVRLIPFQMQIPDSMRVKEFHKVLFGEEGPGILNRLIQGCLDWRKEGLGMSGAIEQATREFRASQNVIQSFFDEHTILGQNNLHAKAGSLYKAYVAWAEQQNEFVIRQNEFAEELARRGFEKKRAHEGFEWWGVGLKSEQTEFDDSA